MAEVAFDIPAAIDFTALREQYLREKMAALETTAADLDLLDYTGLLFPGYMVRPHHRLIADRLEAVERGEVRRLMIFVPPRHGKSELVSIRFPGWFLGKNPNKRVIGCSYQAQLAERFSGLARNQFEDSRWPFAVRLTGDTHSKASWDIAGHRGGYIAAGVGGAITGHGGDLILIDDPIKNWEDADSEIKRQSLWDWYQTTLYTRLEGDSAAIVVVQTRWHEDDLAGRLLEEEANGGDEWEVLSLPAIAEGEDALGRAPGEPLWPDRYPLDKLDSTRSAIGSRNWSALYQQRPTSEEGALFKRAWFQGKIVQAASESTRRWVRYWDLAASTKTTADYTCSVAVGVDDENADVYLRDAVRGRWEWPDAKRIIKQTMLAEPKVEHVIEEAMHGLAAIQELRRDPDLLGISLRGVHVDKDKLTRALPWSARAEAGKVYVLAGPWVNGFLDEVCSFPLAAHDDQVDSVSGGLAHHTRRRRVRI